MSRCSPFEELTQRGSAGNSFEASQIPRSRIAYHHPYPTKPKSKPEKALDLRTKKRTRSTPELQIHGNELVPFTGLPIGVPAFPGQPTCLDLALSSPAAVDKLSRSTDGYPYDPFSDEARWQYMHLNCTVTSEANALREAGCLRQMGRKSRRTADLSQQIVYDDRPLPLVYTKPRPRTSTPKRSTETALAIDWPSKENRQFSSENLASKVSTTKPQNSNENPPSKHVVSFSKKGKLYDYQVPGTSAEFKPTATKSPQSALQILPTLPSQPIIDAEGRSKQGLISSNPGYAEKDEKVTKGQKHKSLSAIVESLSKKAAITNNEIQHPGRQVAPSKKIKILNQTYIVLPKRTSDKKQTLTPEGNSRKVREQQSKEKQEEIFKKPLPIKTFRRKPKDDRAVSIKDVVLAKATWPIFRNTKMATTVAKKRLRHYSAYTSANPNPLLSDEQYIEKNDKAVIRNNKQVFYKDKPVYHNDDPAVYQGKPVFRIDRRNQNSKPILSNSKAVSLTNSEVVHQDNPVSSQEQSVLLGSQNLAQINQPFHQEPTCSVNKSDGNAAKTVEDNPDSRQGKPVFLDNRDITPHNNQFFRLESTCSINNSHGTVIIKDNSVFYQDNPVFLGNKDVPPQKLNSISSVNNPDGNSTVTSKDSSVFAGKKDFLLQNNHHVSCLDSTGLLSKPNSSDNMVAFPKKMPDFLDSKDASPHNKQFFRLDPTYSISNPSSGANMAGPSKAKPDFCSQVVSPKNKQPKSCKNPKFGTNKSVSPENKPPSRVKPDFHEAKSVCNNGKPAFSKNNPTSDQHKSAHQKINLQVYKPVSCTEKRSMPLLDDDGPDLNCNGVKDGIISVQSIPVSNKEKQHDHKNKNSKPNYNAVAGQLTDVSNHQDQSRHLDKPEPLDNNHVKDSHHKIKKQNFKPKDQDPVVKIKPIPLSCNSQPSDQDPVISVSCKAKTNDENCITIMKSVSVSCNAKPNDQNPVISVKPISASFNVKPNHVDQSVYVSPSESPQKQIVKYTPKQHKEKCVHPKKESCGNKLNNHDDNANEQEPSQEKNKDKKRRQSEDKSQNKKSRKDNPVEHYPVSDFKQQSQSQEKAVKDKSKYKEKRSNGDGKPHDRRKQKIRGNESIDHDDNAVAIQPIPVSDRQPGSTSDDDKTKFHQQKPDDCNKKYPGNDNDGYDDSFLIQFVLVSDQQTENTQATVALAEDQGDQSSGSPLEPIWFLEIIAHDPRISDIINGLPRTENGFEYYRMTPFQLNYLRMLPNDRFWKSYVMDELLVDLSGVRETMPERREELEAFSRELIIESLRRDYHVEDVETLRLCVINYLRHYPELRVPLLERLLKNRKNKK